MRQLVSEILEAKPGVRRAIHVLTTALQHRLTDKTSEIPVMALRSSLQNYSMIKLYHKIDLLGPSSMEPLFDHPLPGTAGRGVAILFTEFPVRVWYEEGNRPPAIDSPDDRDPKAILADALQWMDRSQEVEV